LVFFAGLATIIIALPSEPSSMRRRPPNYYHHAGNPMGLND
jgi:hypothetical protein